MGRNMDYGFSIFGRLLLPGELIPECEETLAKEEKLAWDIEMGGWMVFTTTGWASEEDWDFILDLVDIVVNKAMEGRLLMTYTTDVETHRVYRIRPAEEEDENLLPESLEEAGMFVDLDLDEEQAELAAEVMEAVVQAEKASRHFGSEMVVDVEELTFSLDDPKEEEAGFQLWKDFKDFAASA